MKKIPIQKISRIPRRIRDRRQERELGFGSKVHNTSRLMNPDGSFNVEREPITPLDNVYFHLVTIPWVQFFAAAFIFFGILNSVFAALYCMVGIEHLNGTTPGTTWDEFRQAYFFSSQTLTTVGYGHISPSGLLANIIASFESFTGLLIFALISGLLYGRFSRPTAKIAYSENMIIAPYRDGTGLMFRMANARKSELIETEVQMMVGINQRDEQGNTARRFFELVLQINKIAFFNLSWTLVHPLDENSPLYGFSHEDLVDGNAEIMVLVKGTDEATAQLVHSRRSYVPEEIVWNARFLPIVDGQGTGKLSISTRKVGHHQQMAESGPN